MPHHHPARQWNLTLEVFPRGDGEELGNILSNRGAERNPPDVPDRLRSPQGICTLGPIQYIRGLDTSVHGMPIYASRQTWQVILICRRRTRLFSFQSRRVRNCSPVLCPPILLLPLAIHGRSIGIIFPEFWGAPHLGWSRRATSDNGGYGTQLANENLPLERARRCRSDDVQEHQTTQSCPAVTESWFTRLFCQAAAGPDVTSPLFPDLHTQMPVSGSLDQKSKRFRMLVV